MFDKRNWIIIFILLTFSFTGFASFPEGQKLFEKGDYKNAVNEFKKSITGSDSVNEMLALYYLGRAFEKINNQKSAINTYKNFIQRFPDKYLTSAAVDRIKELAPNLKINYEKIKFKDRQSDNKNVRLNYQNKGLALEKEELSYEEYQKNIEPNHNIPIIKPVKTFASEDNSKGNKNNRQISKPISVKKEKKNPNIKQAVAYKVKKGDSLFKISKDFYGRGKYYKDIAKFNKLKDVTSIIEGQILYIPKNSILKKSKINERIVKNKQKINNNKLTKNIRNKKKTRTVSTLTTPSNKTAAINKSKSLKIFNKAEQLYSNKLYIDAIRYYKEYSNNSSGNNTNEDKIAAYKIPLIYHFLGRYDDAIAGYNSYIQEYKNDSSAEIAKYNLANIYLEAFGLIDRAKNIYISILNNTDNSALIKKVQNKLDILHNTRLEDIVKQNEPKKNQTRFKVSEIIPKEKGLISNVNQKRENTDANNISQKKAAIEKIKKVKESENTDNSDITFKPLKKDFDSKELSLPTGLKVLRSFNDRTEKVENIDIKKTGNLKDFIAEGYKLKNMGMYDEAINVYEKAIREYPRDPIAYNNLAYLYVEIGVKLSAAIKLAEQAARLDPGNKGFYLDTIGWAYYKTKEYFKAKNALEQAIFYSPTALRKYHLAKVYEKLNFKDKAIVQLKEARVLQPVGKLGQTLRFEISRLED